jgi:hypothetical protein
MKVIFVSGPYRADTKAGIAQNIKAAREAAKELWRQGWAVFCPHMNTAHFWNVVPDADYLAGDLEILSRCDAIYMLRNWRDSSGAIAEHDAAVDWGLEIIYQV